MTTVSPTRCDYTQVNGDNSGKSQSPDPLSGGSLSNSSSRTSIELSLKGTFTVHEAVEALGFGKFQLKLLMFTSFSWIADSMEMMTLSILSPALQCAWNLDSWHQAFVTTIVFCGMTFSSTFLGTLADRYGRKKTLIYATSISFFFGFLSAFSPHYQWMLVLRGFVGIGLGGVPQCVTLYAEFLPTKARATTLLLLQMSWVAGSLLEVLLAMVIMPTLGWRWLLLFTSCPSLIFCLISWWLPESARFNIIRGRADLARETLEQAAKENGKTLPAGSLVLEKEIELKDFKTHRETEKSRTSATIKNRGRVFDLFSPDLKRTTILLWFLWIATASSYYGVVLMSTALYQKGSNCAAGGLHAPSANVECSLECHTLSTRDYVDLMFVSSAEIPGIILSVILIDFIGRRWTLFSNVMLAAVVISVLIVCLTRTWLTIVLCLARAAVASSFQITYIYTPEVYPTTLRSVGVGAGSMWGRIGSAVTPFIAQVLLTKSLYWACGVYGLLLVLSAAASGLLPIETKGRKMMDI